LITVDFRPSETGRRRAARPRVIPASPRPIYRDGMAAKFEVFPDKGGKYHFHLKAPNGEIIVASQAYATKANAHKGIQAIKTHAADAKVEDLSG
jgi:uncharacterized protein YegP (UPF0339 family)